MSIQRQDTLLILVTLTIMGMASIYLAHKSGSAKNDSGDNIKGGHKTNKNVAKKDHLTTKTEDIIKNMYKVNSFGICALGVVILCIAG